VRQERREYSCNLIRGRIQLYKVEFIPTPFRYHELLWLLHPHQAHRAKMPMTVLGRFTVVLNNAYEKVAEASI